MADRKIGDITHPMIRNADELIVWFHKESKFKLINSSNCPKWQSKNCKICPTFYNKTDGSPFYCLNKIQNFEEFKNHLGNAERALGECVAFPVGYKSLPSTDCYKKYRRYGYLHDYTKKDSFLIFDIENKRFERVNRTEIPKLYSNGEKCTYCPCNRKTSSVTNFLKHLQVLETQFYCFLIIDKESQNDKRNQERLRVFMNDIKGRTSNRSLLSSGNKSMNRFKEEIMSDDDSMDESTVNKSNNVPNLRSSGINRIQNGLYNDQIDNNASDNDDRVASMNELDNNAILKNMEALLKKSSENLNGYIGQLRSKLNSTNLNQGIIDNQNLLSLSKRNEDFQKKEKELTFYTDIKLTYEDLDFLMKKYGIKDDYEICEANLTLNIQLKEVCPANCSPIKSNLSITNSSSNNLSINLSLNNLSSKKNSSIKNSSFKNLKNSDTVNEHRVNEEKNQDKNDEGSSNQMDYEHLELVLSNESNTDNSRILKLVPKNIEQVNSTQENEFDLIKVKKERDLVPDEDVPNLSNFKRARID